MKLCGMLVICAFVAPASIVSQPTTSTLTPIQVTGLHNVFRLTPQIYSGSGPENDKAFEALAALGIKTIMSVDGAKPNLDAAKKHGLRYVHLPIGYNSVPRERVVQLAKAMNECSGPIYLHCHHGIHRGPTAAAIAQLCADPKCTVADALQFMKSAGTDPRYKGLFDSVEKFTRPSEDELKRASPLPESSPVAAFTQAMVAIDQHFNHLKLARKAGWKAPAEHPDIEPGREALQLVEHYKELRRRPDVAKKPADFQTFLREGEAAARDLESALNMKKGDAKAAEAAFHRTSMICVSCHAKFRD
jgi:hypothetical protein